VCLCRVAFRQLLSTGDKDVVYPILKWVVPQPQLLEKRAFVGYYLSFPDVSYPIADTGFEYSNPHLAGWANVAAMCTQQTTVAGGTSRTAGHEACKGQMRGQH
jgi:hypothetical protein